MKKLITTTLFCATSVLFTACGGSSDGVDRVKNELELIGVPKSMVSQICSDQNDNGLCEKGELLEFLYDTNKGSAVYDSEIVKESQSSILVEIGDPAQTNVVEDITLEFPNDVSDLSMEAYILDVKKSSRSHEENNAAFFALMKNINLLGNAGLPYEKGDDKGVDGKGKMAIDWIVTSNFEEEDFDLEEYLTLTKEEAYAIAKDIRGKEKALVNDKLVESFQCKTGEVRTVKNYGLEDIFSTSNGAEPSYPSAHLTNFPSVVAYNARVNSGLVGYDNTSNDRFFGESINGLPSGITSGRFYIGLKSNGSSLQYNDALYIGEYGVNHFSAHLEDLAPQRMWSNQLVSTTNPTTDIYWNDFSAIDFNLGNTHASLLEHVQANKPIDVLVQDDTSVDFITVATCSKKDPIAEIKPVLEGFQCKSSPGADNETKHTIIGGTIDAFASGQDLNSMPSSSLVNATSAYPSMDYDSTSYDKFFRETLAIPSGYISSARFSMGVKALGTLLSSNDTLTLGYTHSSDQAGFKLYGNASNSVNALWNVTPISNGENIIQTDFNLNTVSGANALTWLRGESELDIVVQDDTSVDFVQLDVCVRKSAPCVDTDGDGFCDDEEIKAGSDPKDPLSTPNDLDGDGVNNADDCDPNDPTVSTDCEPALPESCNQDISVDLSQGSSWLNASGVAPTENNVFINHPQYPGIIWDGSMNWFDFGSASNAQHNLSLDFCSCGGGEVVIDQMKSDNYSSVKLDNGSAIVERTAHSQSTMASWGPDVSGSQTIPYSGNGTNHSLTFKVQNVFGPSGGAIDGTLNFKGHLGKCTDKDVLVIEKQIKEVI